VAASRGSPPLAVLPITKLRMLANFDGRETRVRVPSLLLNDAISRLAAFEE
jgi:hypothetical protein